MAKKSFVLSNGDGRVIFSNTGSNGVYLDDAINGHISASNLYIANNYTIRSITASPTTYRMLSASAGQFATSSVSGVVSPTVGPSGALGFNGTSSVVTSIMNPSDYAGIPSDQTYLSGNYQEGIKVININTVSSGALKPAYGGTGLSGSQYAASKNLILEGSGSSPTAFSILSASASGTIIVSGEGRFHVQYPSYKPDVRFYGTPGTYTWTRPIGARFARVILQGAGGGGGGSSNNRLATPTVIFGGGGGAGAYTETTIDVSMINTMSVFVGAGGTGGIGMGNSAISSSTSPAATIGGIGGTTSITCSNLIIYSNGGGGGTVSAGGASSGGSAFPINYGGFSKKGGAGGRSWGGATAYNIPAETTYGVSSGGGGGWNQVGGSIVMLTKDRNYGYNTTTDNVSLDILISSGSNGAIYPSNDAMYTTASKPNYGAGGGGGTGFVSRYSPCGPGGNGGNGYALIISW